MTPVDVFIANTPLHVLYAVALTRALPSLQHEIHWFGKDAIVSESPLGQIAAGANVVDYRHLPLNDFRGYLDSANEYLGSVRETVPAIERLFSCYETHYAAEALRNAYDMPWGRVGVIEDGIGNYFAHSMTRRRLQLPKAVAALIVHRHRLTLTRHNLGGNPRIGLVSALAPEHVHLASGSRARIVPMQREVRALLDESRGTVPDVYGQADVLLFLPPVLHYGRLDRDGLARYVERVKAHPSVQGLERLTVKPHPRDPRDDVTAALAQLGDDVQVGGDDPIELVMRDLDNAVWAGSPTTAMLNKHVLFPGRTRYVLFPLAGNRHVENQTEVLLRILGDSGELAE